MYQIVANNKRYEIIEHAMKRMRQRNITEEMIIDVMEQGDLIRGNRDTYEKEIDFPDGSYRIIKVAVEEKERLIITVIDTTPE